MTDTTTTAPVQEQSPTFELPVQWEGMPYGEHWSFSYTTERGDREDYDFRIELHEDMSDAEERAVIGLIEAAPKLLDVLQALCALKVKGHALIDRLQFSEQGRALAAKITAAIAEAKGMTA